MALTVHREDLASLHGEWAALLSRSDEPVPLFHPTWHRVWLEEFQGTGELLLLAARDGEELIGVAPLLRDGDKLSFAGHYSICDYMDFVVAPDRAGDAFAALLDTLLREPWSELELRGLRQESATIAELLPRARAAGLSVEQEEEAVAPRIDLPESWAAYEASLGKKDRHELRRKLRRLQGLGETVLRIFTAPAEVEEHTQVLLRLMVESRTDKASFMSEQMGRFFHRMTPALAAEGLVRLYELEIADKPVASVLCLDQGGRLYFYNSGYDPQYAGFSVGLGSKALVLEEAISSGRRSADFLRGREPYKYDLGATDRHIYQATIRR